MCSIGFGSTLLMPLKAFVPAPGKGHVATGARERFATAADKTLFQSIMEGVGLATLQPLAIVQAGRCLPRCPTIVDPSLLAGPLREPACCPPFR